MVLALPLLAWSAQDPQAEFAREALAAIAAGDDVRLGELVHERPYRARVLGHELLWEALRAGAGDTRPLAAAQRLARALEEAPADDVEIDVADVVARVRSLDAEERVRQRELDRAFFAATAALRGGDRSAVDREAGLAAEAAQELALPYLELRARRLQAEGLRNEPGFRDALLSVLELERALGLWTEEALDLATLAEVEVLEGRLVEAAGRLERAESLARRTRDPERAVELVARRGLVLANLGRFEAARELLTAAHAHFESGARGAEVAEVATLLGELAGGAGRYEEALARFAEAVRAARAAGDARREARATLRLAGTCSELGLVTEAEDALGRALAVLREHELVPELEHGLLARGLVELDAGRPREALDTFEALEPREGGGALYAEARRLSGAAHLLLGEAQAAEGAFRAALAAWSADPLKNAWARTGLGDALFLQGMRTEAEREYRTALEAAAGVSSLERGWRARVGLGRCAEAGGRNESALEHFTLAIEEIEALRDLLAAPALRARWLGNKLEPYQRGARLLARSGRLDEAYRWAEAAKARTLLEVAARPLAPQREIRGQDERRTSLARARLEAAESGARLLELQLGALPSTPASAGTREELVGRLRAARSEQASARLELELADPRGALLLGLSQAPGLGEAQAALRADERLLHYVIGGEFAALFVVSPYGARFVELGTDEGELQALVQRLLEPIERLRRGRLGLATLGFDVHAAEELERLLIKPVRAELAGCHTLWVVPEGPLRRLPFALLVRAREKRPVDPSRLFAQYAGCRFLIEDAAVGHLPSAGLLRASRPSGAETRACLVVADPEPRPRDALELARSATEARAVAAHLAPAPVRLLLGSEAGEARVKQALAGARVAHFATHGLLDDRRPAYSRLALAPGEGEDGWLHAYEIEELSLAAERVVLAACETLGQAGRGEGLLGLARSFLQAGARSVVASAWAVDDQATAELMQHYLAALAGGEEPVAALRSAQVALLRGPGRPGLLYLHPYFWGAFQHVGAR
jgi:CHAT domain-containing protein/tetratricopeptide (TPR) repeat protein